MSKQVEQIRAEVERRIKSWEAGVKYEGDEGDCQSRVTELTDLKKFIDSLPAKENPILVPESKETTIEIAGKRVRVAYRKPGEDCCARCCFSFGGGETCAGLDGGEEWPCEKFDLATAYFVEAEQPEADLEAEIDTALLEELQRFVKDDWNTLIKDGSCSIAVGLARHFAEWGRKKVLQEIHDGKYNVADKHIAAWLKDK